MTVTCISISISISISMSLKTSISTSPSTSTSKLSSHVAMYSNWTYQLYFTIIFVSQHVTHSEMHPIRYTLGDHTVPGRPESCKMPHQRLHAHLQLHQYVLHHGAHRVRFQKTLEDSVTIFFAEQVSLHKGRCSSNNSCDYNTKKSQTNTLKARRGTR